METIDYKDRADDMGQYIEEMHRMMNKASTRLAFLVEEEYPRGEQIECMKTCIGLLQGESYEKYRDRIQWIFEKNTKK